MKVVTVMILIVFLISLKYIFWRLVNPKSSRSEVFCSNSSPNFVNLSAPSNVSMVRLWMLYLVLDVDALGFFCWDNFLFLLVDRDGASLDQVDFFGILLKGIDESTRMSIYFILLSVIFVVNLLIRWSTSFYCSIVIRLRRYLANLMFPRSSYSSACWRRWSFLWLAKFRFTCFNWFFANFRLLMIVLMQYLSMFAGRFIVLMLWFIFSSFDVLPNVCHFINIHRDTSRMVLARSGDHGSRCSILLREASTSRSPLVIKLSSASIFGMSLLVSLLVFMSPFSLSDCRIMSCCFTYASRIYLYFLLVWCRLIVKTCLRVRYCFGIGFVVGIASRRQWRYIGARMGILDWM